MPEANFFTPMTKFQNKQILQVLSYYHTIAALESLSSLAGWDLETNMPEAAVSDRGFVLAKADSLIQRLMLDKEFRFLVSKLDADKSELNEYERAVVRVLRREIQVLEKLPPAFIEEFNRRTIEAQVVWRRAKQENHFKLFAPSLQKIVDLTKKKTEYLGYVNQPYDALIDLYEEGWTTADLEDFFTRVKPSLKGLLTKITSSTKYCRPVSLADEKYETQTMKKLNESVLQWLNGDSKKMRVDVSAHPFETAISLNDVRITGWYQGKDFRRSLTAVIHEFGHALYELNSDPDLAFTPLQGGVSYGVHESQSRFWENIIGRHPVFLEKIYHRAKELLPFLSCSTLEDFVFYFNFVRPSLIRVEADELTYHFHIMLRFEIERDLIEGNLKIQELPEMWRAKMKKYLKVEPSTDTEGVLQDIHWSSGAFGYFPTYSIGTFLSSLWQEKLEQDLGRLEQILKQDAGIGTVANWLKENIHQFGQTYTSKELIKKVTGKDFSPEPYLRYLTSKYSSLYSV